MCPLALRAPKLAAQWSPQKGHCIVTVAQRRAVSTRQELAPRAPAPQKGRCVRDNKPGTRRFCAEQPQGKLWLHSCSHLCAAWIWTPMPGSPHSQTFTPLFANLMTCTHPCTSLKTLWVHIAFERATDTTPTQGLGQIAMQKGSMLALERTRRRSKSNNTEISPSRTQRVEI